MTTPEDQPSRPDPQVDPGPLPNVYLPDSWVLAIETADSFVCFTLDAVLEPGHDRYYSLPRPGEQHAYQRLRWCLRGEVWWNDGPHLDHPAVDANEELDYGHINAWWSDGDVDHLEGSWGIVAIRGAVHEVTYLT